MLRELRADDLPELQGILKATEAFTAAEVEVAMELLEIVVGQPEQRDYEVAVAELLGKVAGYVLFGPVPATAGNYNLYWIAVDPAAQGTGIGQRLLGYVEEAVCRRGGRMVCLETSSQGGYGRTRSFYEKAGYHLESRIRDFYKPGDDRLTYVKRF